jgi:aryl-alcohol dehydrogenase-like predicted oxidoreductase
MKGALGFGCYRVSDREAIHESALRHAITSGISLIDTSANYGDGASERLVGRVLAGLPDHAPTVVTKIGYAQGALYDMTKIQEEIKTPYADVVDVTDGVRHCIHPDFLEDVLHVSLDRLAQPRVDVLLLHNPEYFLQIGHQQGMDIDEARSEFYRRIRLAFEWMEDARSRDLITNYGLSSNTLGHGFDAPDFVSLEECIRIAQDVGGLDHGFTHVQMPLNLIEHHVVTMHNQGPLRDGQFERTTLQTAQEYGLHVLTNRPLNALVGQEVIRLATHDVPVHPVAADAVEARIHELEVLEHKVQQSVTQALADGSEGVNEQDAAIIQEAYRVAAALCQSWNRFEGLMHWRDVRRSYLEPRLNIIHQYNERAGELTDAQDYADQLRSVITDIETLYASEENVSLEELRSSLVQELGLDPDTPLQHVALHALRNTEGVGTVLVGMRHPTYVDDALITSGLPDEPIDRSTWDRIAALLARLSS